MEKNITITIENNPEEVAEMLWNMDDAQIAKAFELWFKKHESEYNRMRKEKPNQYFVDHGGMAYYISNHMSEEGKDCIRNLYAAIWNKETGTCLP